MVYNNPAAIVGGGEFKDPYPTSYLFPKTICRSSSTNSDPAQSLLHSLGDGEMKKLMGDLEIVLGKEPSMEARGNADGQPQARKRRPDLGIKRARFSLMPENKENAPQVDTKPNFNQLEDPEDYFDAYERMEFADKEMRKLRGESVLEVQGQNEQVGGARVRRPALQLGRKSTFGFLYPKFSDHLENVPSKRSSQDHASAQLTPELNGLDNHGKNLDSVVGDTSRDMVETDIPENETNAGSEDARGSAEDMLGELLVSCRSLNDTQTRNLLQDRLNIKPLVREKLDLPDLDCMPEINLEEPEVNWRSRKSNPSSQPTDGTGSGWNMLAKDQPPTMGAVNTSTPRMPIEAAKLPSSGGKNSVSYLRRTLSSILGRNEENLFSGQVSPASQAKIAKETNLLLSGRREIKFRSGSSMLPKPLNLKEGVRLERDSGSIRLSLNMNSEDTTAQSFREEEVVVANSQEESVTVESRLMVEALEKEPGDVNINQRDNLFLGESPASQAKISKKTNSALCGRTEIKLRSRSIMLPKTLNMNEGVSPERDSRSIRLSLNMNSKEITPQGFREEEFVVPNRQEESVTVESRLEVEAFEKVPGDVNLNQRDDFTQSDIHVGKSFDKYDSPTVENTEEMDNGNLPEASVSLQPVIPSESFSTETRISNQEEPSKDKEIELPPVEVLEKSNNGTDANVKEATSPISDNGTKSRGRNKRMITRSLTKKHSVSVLVLEKDAPSLDTTPVEIGIRESSDGLREPEPVRIETVVAQQTNTRPEVQSRRSAFKRLSLAEKLAATLDSSPAEKLLPESAVVMEEQESARVEFNTASENEVRQDMITESNRVGSTDAAVKETAQPKVVKKRKETRKSLAGYGTEWQGGLRRSTRPKRKPLRWYKGERFIYGRIHESLATVIGVKYQTKDDGKNVEYDVECCVEEKYREFLESGSYH